MRSANNKNKSLDDNHLRAGPEEFLADTCIKESSEKFSEGELCVCKACHQGKTLSAFPKKGAGRYEDKCKPCHNNLAKERRQKRNPKERSWSIESARHTVKYNNQNNCNFIDVLYQILKSKGLVCSPEQILSVDSLIQSGSKITELLEQKGNSNEKGSDICPSLNR